MTGTPTQTAQEIVKRLGGKWHGSYGMACCPAHPDRTPSLSVRAGDHIVLFHCFAGCSPDDVRAALDTGKIAYKANTKRDQVNERKPNLRQLARQIWRDALPVGKSPANAYLKLRGISMLAIGRYDPAAVTYENEKKLALPALILPIEDSKGITAIQRIFLDRTTGRKSSLVSGVKRTLGNPDGGAIRIRHPPADILHLAEGVEDAGAAMILNSLPHCWAACGIERYGQIEIPETIRIVVIWSQHGPEAENAIERARPHLEAGGRQLHIQIPPGDGDWNDILLSRNKVQNQTVPRDETTPSAGHQEVIETSAGPIWTICYHDSGTMRVWWPKRSRAGIHAAKVLEGNARWNERQRAWYVARTNVSAVKELLGAI